MLQKNKMAQRPWVAYLIMSVRMVREKHHIAHQTVFIMHLTALSIKPTLISLCNLGIEAMKELIDFMMQQFLPSVTLNMLFGHI